MIVNFKVKSSLIISVVPEELSSSHDGKTILTITRGTGEVTHIRFYIEEALSNFCSDIDGVIVELELPDLMRSDSKKVATGYFVITVYEKGKYTDHYYIVKVKSIPNA